MKLYHTITIFSLSLLLLDSCKEAGDISGDDVPGYTPVMVSAAPVAPFTRGYIPQGMYDNFKVFAASEKDGEQTVAMDGYEVKLCPEGSLKAEPGVCGCDVEDVDGDGDTIMDCVDLCPEDQNKKAPGTCGCGVPDTDTDGDTVPDCFDLCPEDPNKKAPGTCGCGMPDIDTDGDTVPDCLDKCPEDPNKTLAGLCGCGVVDTP